MKSKLSVGLSALALGAALALTACSGTPATPTEPAGQNITVGALDAFAFDPAALSAKVGEEVTVTLDNKGVLEHNFVITEFDVHLGPLAGGTKSAPGTFTPTAAGTYTYFCDVPGHREAGMEGTLTVSE